MTAQKLQYPMVLTDKQYTVYRFYEIFYEKNKLYPTMEQARVALGYKRASSVQRHLMALDKLGVMTSLRGQWIITAPVALILKLPKRRIAIKYLEFPITDSPEDEKRRRAIIDYGRALGWNECIDFIDKPKPNEK